MFILVGAWYIGKRYVFFVFIGVLWSFAELPENAKWLMDCEAFEILEGVKAHMAVLSEDPSIKIPV